MIQTKMQIASSSESAGRDRQPPVVRPSSMKITTTIDNEVFTTKTQPTNQQQTPETTTTNK